ncbi:MAG: helicase-related protein, partial [Dokdonella sp.]
LEFLDGSLLNDEQRQRLFAEFHTDLVIVPPDNEIDYSDDPRLPWLIDLIDSTGTDKLLLICRSAAKVMALEEALRTRSGVSVARFHEGMTLLQRDRNAAFFADAGGARLLLCSEIGSEGRNFQFAHRIVMWDLPLDPDLLEQRIGRLDRIGQKHDIRIHAVAYTGTAQQVMLRWFNEGVDAFSSSPADGRELLRRFGRRLVSIADSHAHGGEDVDAEVDSLIAETHAVHEELSALVHGGRDRLLELASERGGREQYLLHAMNVIDRDDNEDYVTRLFEQFGVAIEEMAPGIVLLDPEHLSTDGFPGLRDGPQQATFQRSIALSREDLPLLQLDHPMVAGAMDLLLEGEHGNAAFLVDDQLPPRSALLECLFVLECVADRKLSVDRYLPPLPIRVVIDSRLQKRNDFRASDEALRRTCERAVEYARYKPVLAKLVPPMLAQAEILAKERAATEIETAMANAERDLGAELTRLTALARVNPAVRSSEIDAVRDELAALRAAMPTATPRLDAVRFACSKDFLALR